MTVEQLIENLLKIEEDSEVFISSDAEMNGVSLFESLECLKVVKNTINDEPEFVSPEDEGEHKEKELKNAVILFPR